MANNDGRFERTSCLDFQESRILGRFYPKKSQLIGIHVPNDTESQPTELNPHVSARTDLYFIGKTTVENNYTVILAINQLNAQNLVL